jgi:hypothetical protein
VGHLRSNGFVVNTVHLSDSELMAKKRSNSVRDEFSACHTAMIDGYIVEGHVPSEDILRMLEEKPEIVGLAVPGMPVGAPGMETPSGQKDPFEVLAFDAEGNTRVYAKY